MAWDHGLPGPRLHRHPDGGGVAHRRRGGGGAFGGRLETRRGPDNPRPRLSHAIRANGPPPLGPGLRNAEPLPPQIYAATSVASGLYSCPAIGAGVAVVVRDDALR